MIDRLDSWLTTAPVSWANSLTMALFMLLLVLLWSFPKAVIVRDAPDNRWWRDLRIWGTVLIFLQLTIYALFR